MIRVVKGNPDNAELAALTVVLLAAAARAPVGAVECATWQVPQWTHDRGAPWHRPDHAVRSWRGHRRAGKGR